MKPFTKIAALVFGLAAAVHLCRLFMHFRVVVGSHEIPVAASIVLLIGAIVLCLGLVREGKK